MAAYVVKELMIFELAATRCFEPDDFVVVQGCSPIKAVRELGLERRETVEQNALSINSAICWKHRVSLATYSCHRGVVSSAHES